MNGNRNLPLRRGAALAAAGMLALSACGGGTDAEAEGSATREVRSDHTDSMVEIPEDPQRIVAIGWAVTPLISVEEADLVGVSRGTQDTSLTPGELEKVEELPSVGTDLDINIEEVAALEPDLIISGLAAAMDYDHSELEKVAPVVQTAMNAPSEWKDMNDRVADAAGVADAHAELIDAYDAQAQELADTYADRLDGVQFASVAAWGDGNWVLEHQLAHGTTVPADAGLAFTEQAEDGAFSESLSLEQLSRLDDYDAILLRAEADGTPTEPVQQVMDQGPWQELEAVQQDRVFAVPHLGAMSYTTGMLVFDELEERVLTQL